MNIVLLGAPGAGKGSVSEMLVKEKFYHLSTGNALREMASKDNELGHSLNEILKSGKLVSDDVVNKILQLTLQNIDLSQYAGIIFDGYPRTESQAKFLNSLVKIDKVLFIKVPDEIIEKRLVNRRICVNCGKIYNLQMEGFKPKNPQFCDACGGLLMQRKDDNINIIKDRLDTYYKEIQPLIDYYKNQKVLLELDGTLPLDEWRDLVLKLIK